MRQPRSRMPTRRTFLAGVTAPAAFVAAACGGAADTGAPNGGKASQSTSVPITLDVAWESTTNDMGQFVTGQAKQLFEQRHPGVTLNIISTGNAPDKVLAQAAAGTPPNVLWVGGGNVTSFVSKSLLLAIDALLQKDKDVKKSDFVPKMWDIFTVQGKQYGLPREGGPTVLYFNKSLVTGGGVSAPNESWTLATEYRDATVKLTHPDVSVAGTHVGDWRTWVFSNGGDIFDASASKCTLDQPSAVEAMQLLQDFRYKFKCAITPQDNAAQAAMPRFMAGGLALFPGLRSAGNTSGFVQPNVGIAPHPKGKAGRLFNSPGNGIAVVQPNKAPDFSWEVVKWYVSAEYQKLHYKLGVGGVVARPAVLQSEEYLTSAIPRDWNEAFARDVTFLKGPPKLSNWPDIDVELEKQLGDFQNGLETAAAATARIAPILNALLKAATLRG